MGPDGEPPPVCLRLQLLACVRIGVDPPVELVRALDGVRKIMEKTGSAGADQARELHTLIADRSESRANPS